MKTLSKVLFLSIAVLSLESCKKKIYGCMDQTAENYSPIATEDAKNCSYAYQDNDPDEVIISNTVYDVSWTAGASYWGTTLYWPEITNTVLNNGAVNAYMYDGTSWIGLPVTINQTGGYTTSIVPFFTAGECYIEWSDSDGTMPLTPPSLDIKLVILK